MHGRCERSAELLTRAFERSHGPLQGKRGEVLRSIRSRRGVCGGHSKRRDRDLRSLVLAQRVFRGVADEREESLDFGASGEGR